MWVDISLVAAKLFLAFFVLLSLIPLMVWAERKGSAYIQDRPGPNRATILGLRLGGLFHPLADAIKFLAKENLMPTQAHPFYFRLAPFLVMLPAFTAFIVIPFGDTVEIFGRTVRLQIANLNVGILYIFAISSLGVYGIMLAGWSSNNKFALLGSLRSTAQMISYELALGLSVVGVILIYGSVDLNVIVQSQGKFFWKYLPAWGVFLQPLGFVLFLVAILAETNRNPFDLPEGESEIVAGYHLEYSSMRFASFFMAEYTNMIVGSALVATLFFGGWQVPFLENHGFVFSDGEVLPLSQGIVVLLRLISLAIKTFIFCWFFIWVRWTLPRFRYDQLMKLGWQIMLPLALINVLATAMGILWM